MNEFVLMTDSGCDLPRELLQELQVIPVELTLQTAEGLRLSPAALDMDAFYRDMRNGSTFQTSAANLGDYLDAFEPALRRGQDVLYLCFSSGLSSTVNAARLAASELRGQYPERQVAVLDSLCASTGLGLLLRLAARKRDAGCTIAETEAALSAAIPRLCHWFTVDSLVYLRRGGRLSAARAILGEAMNLKPVMHMDDSGHLVSRQKVRGRTQAIRALAEKYAQLAADPAGEYLIAHGDCYADAKRLEALLSERFDRPAALITEIGPVIGSHSGPGTLALFFLGKQR